MKVAELLHPEGIVIPLSAGDRKQAVRILLEAAARSRGFDAAAAQRDVEAREGLGTTLIPAKGEPVAFPHAETNACKQLVLAVGIAPEGVPWDHAGTARVLFLLLGPQESHSLYLKVLARLARLCGTEGFLHGLLGCRTPEDLIARMATAEEPLGAIPPAEDLPKFCVIGAGNGGLAMAGHLALLGCRVSLFNRTAERLLPLKARGGIDVKGTIEGFARISVMTDDPGEALKDADAVMVVVPATSHADVTRRIGPFLKDGQILILHPGRTGGALEAARVLRETAPAARPYIAEAQTLLYASRITNPGEVHIFAVKNAVPLAAFPSYAIADILPVIRRVLPQFVPGDNVLKTSLENIGAVFHPAITVLNAARIEDTHGDFEFYLEGVTPSVAAVLERIDRERIAVASALGFHVNSAREWLYLAYDAAGKTLCDAIHANANYGGIKAPPTVMHRYISEDVPASLVPLTSLGDMLGVPTPAMKAIILTASTMYGVDFQATGRTAERLGLKGLSMKEIRFLLAGADTERGPGVPGPPSGEA